MRRTLTLFGLAAALASAAAAQRVGQEAPEITWNKTFNFHGIKSQKLSDLQGSAVLLEFFLRHGDENDRRMMLLNNLHRRLFDRGLVVVGVTIDDEKVLEKYLTDEEIAFPVAIASFEGYETKEMPIAVLIGPDRKVLWRDHPDKLDHKQIDAALTNARPANIAAGLEEVGRLGAAGKMGEAYAKAKELLAAGSLSAEAQEQAQRRIKDAEQLVHESVEAAKTALGGGEFYKVFALLDPIAKSYQGVPRVDEAAAMVAAMLADKKQKREVDAGQALAQVEEMAKKRDYDNAFKAYKKVASSFGGTKAALAANAAALAIEKGGKLGYMRGCGACEAADKTCPLHSKKKR